MVCLTQAPSRLLPVKELLKKKSPIKVMYLAPSLCFLRTWVEPVQANSPLEGRGVGAGDCSEATWGRKAWGDPSKSQSIFLLYGCAVLALLESEFYGTVFLKPPSDRMGT